MGKNSLTEILKSNAQFYHAFEGLSIDMMDNLWKHDENVICVHPGWELLIGWLATRGVRLFDNGGVGIVVCQENIETSDDGQKDRIGVIATNIFERCANRWLMIHHQGSSISNYMPPNISPQ